MSLKTFNQIKRPLPSLPSSFFSDSISKKESMFFSVKPSPLSVISNPLISCSFLPLSLSNTSWDFT